MIGAGPPQQMQQLSSQPGSAGTPTPHNPMTPTGAPLSNPPMQGTPQPAPPPQPQATTPQQVSRSSMQPSDICKEKLMINIYEYLMMNGGPKTAEALKAEFGQELPNAKWPQSTDGSSSFLATWWSLFYDLYCAAPERRNDPEFFSSPDAKMFHDIGMVPSTAPFMMNGMPYGAPSPMMGPGSEMMGFPGRFAPRPGMPHPQMTFAPMMAGAGRAMVRAPPQMFPQMRPQGAPLPPQAMYRGPFMDGGTNPHPGAFPGGPMGMAPNGMMGPPMGGMSSPGPMHMAPGGNAFMMMPGTSAGMPPQYGMGGMVGQDGMMGHPQPIQQPPLVHTPVGNGPPSSGQQPGTSGTPVQGVLNGGEMKHSPIGTPRQNGGTPGGPGSGAPGSVHSTHGVGSVPSQSVHTPKAEPDTTTNGANGQEEEVNEISKIKQSLIEDFSGGDSAQSDAPFNY